MLQFWGFSALCLAVSFVDSKSGASQQDATVRSAKAATQPADFVKKLNSVVSLAERIEGPLSDTLQFFTRQFGLPLHVDVAVFAEEIGEPDVLVKVVRIDAVNDVRLSTLLQRLSNQVQGGFLVGADHVAIVPKTRIDAFAGPNSDGGDLLGGGRITCRAPLVNAVIENQTLHNALRELTGQTGVSIVLDIRRSGELAQSNVTATLLNAPIQTVVRVLANQAELDVAVIDNVLYVTTSENAEQLRNARQ